MTDLKLSRPKGKAAARLRPLGLACTLALLMAAPIEAGAARGPGEISDVADQVVDAVVNISATTTEQVRSFRTPGDLQNTPFDDLFDDFFNRKRQGQGGDAPAQPPRMRKSNSLGSGFVVDPSGSMVTNNHVWATQRDRGDLHRRLESQGRDGRQDAKIDSPLRVEPNKPLKAVKSGDSKRCASANG